MDDRGYVIVAPRQARMSEARPLKLHRSKTLDWAALIRTMAAAVRKIRTPLRRRDGWLCVCFRRAG